MAQDQFPGIPKLNLIGNVYNEPRPDYNSQKKPSYEPTAAEVSDIERAIGILENNNSSLDSVREAVRVLKMLAEKGVTDVCEALGTWYIEGSHFLRKSPEKFVHYMTLAANSGSEYAMSDLAWAYLKGADGVEQNHFLAHVLYHALHKLHPTDQEYTLFYALGLFNGYPSDPESDSGLLVDNILECSDAILSEDLCKSGLRGAGYAMIQSLANDGYPAAKAIVKELRVCIVEEVAARVGLNVFYSLL